MSRRTLVLPRPLLKWAGGKGELLPELLRRLDMLEGFGRYHEPFMGGGALFFELVRLGKMPLKKARLSDNNKPLAETYLAVREDVDRVIKLLLEHKARHGEDYFYAVRARKQREAPKDRFARAARIVYLNKTCYNGLYRENSKGQFNTPFGRYKNPNICDEPNLRATAEALKKATIEHAHFTSVLEHAEPGDFVYLDPPYHPISRTSSFTAYDKGGFNEDSQRLLAGTFRELSGRGVHVLLSNSMTDFVRELYRDFRIDEVMVTRSINSKGDKRGRIGEALVRNF